MRRSAEKVKEAILHPDKEVREASVYYFSQSYSADPAIMPLVIQAIEQFGWQDAFEAYSFMEKLAQTKETVQWLIRQLEEADQPASEEEARPTLAYLPALVHADPSLLQQHQAEES